MISEKGKIFSKHLRNMQIIEYFTILFLSLIIIKYERKKVVLEIFELRLTQRLHKYHFIGLHNQKDKIEKLPLFSM